MQSDSLTDLVTDVCSISVLWINIGNVTAPLLGVAALYT